MNPEQASLLDDLMDTDIAAIEAELQALQIAPAATEKKQKYKRTALPAEFPSILIIHEPDNTQCPCGCALKRIDEDINEKMDYTPGVFTVERQIRGRGRYLRNADPDTGTSAGYRQRHLNRRVVGPCHDREVR